MTEVEITFGRSLINWTSLRRTAKGLTKTGVLKMHEAYTKLAQVAGYKDYHELCEVQKAMGNPPVKKEKRHAKVR